MICIVGFQEQKSQASRIYQSIGLALLLEVFAKLVKTGKLGDRLAYHLLVEGFPQTPFSKNRRGGFCFKPLSRLLALVPSA